MKDKKYEFLNWKPRQDGWSIVASNQLVLWWHNCFSYHFDREFKSHELVPKKDSSVIWMYETYPVPRWKAWLTFGCYC